MSQNYENIELDKEAASRILSNVLKQSNKKDSGVPLEVMESYTEYKMPFIRTTYALLGILLIIVFSLIFFTTQPRFTINEVSKDQNGTATYMVKIENIYPVKNVTATLDGEKIGSWENEKGFHFVTPRQEGKLVITVTLKNGQYSTYEKMIGGIDVNPPKYISMESIAKNTIRIYLEDDGAGIDYIKAFAVEADGTSVKPVHYGYNFIDFKCKSGANIYIPDKFGNTLHLIVAN